MKRIGIFLFFDKNGIVRDYVIKLINKIRPFYSDFCIVVNEYLTEEGQKTLTKLCDKLIVRKNIGMDVMAYKEAIESYGYDKLSDYDELLLMNYTIFGPFYDLTDMYNEMDKRDCDLWSIFKWPTFKNYKDPTSLICNHLPSFFISYRNSVLKSEHFKNYWENLPEIKTYEDSCVKHEQRQTSYYEQLGFKTDAYIDNTKYKKNWNISYPYDCMLEMIKNDKCPFIKCRHFFIDTKIKFPQKSYSIFEILDYLNNIGYDKNIILKATIDRINFNDLPKIKLSYRLLTLLGSARYKNRIENYDYVKSYLNFLKNYQNNINNNIIKENNHAV